MIGNISFHSAAIRPDRTLIPSAIVKNPNVLNSIVNALLKVFLSYMKGLSVKIVIVSAVKILRNSVKSEPKPLMT